MRRLLIIWLGLMLSQPVWAANDTLPVWRINSGDAEVILLGSIHLAFPQTYPLRPEIENAFSASDHLVVEVDVGGADAGDLQRTMLQRGTLPPGQTLEGQLSPEVWSALKGYLRSRGLPLQGFERFRPGLAVITLSTMRLMEMGMRPELGIDLHFLEQARGNKPIIELETPEQQIDLMLGFEDKDLLVQQTLVQLDEIDLYMRPIYEAWRSGDIETLDRLLLVDELAREPRFKPIYEMLYDERNRAMTTNILAYLAGEGRYFVVVGAGHLVGENGIIAALERRGFTVTPL